MKHKRRFIKDYVNVDDVRKMIKQGKTWDEISNCYGFSKDRVRKYCHTHGIYINGKYNLSLKENVNIDDVIMMINNGMKWNDISKKCKIPKDQLKRYCNKNKVFIKGKYKGGLK